MYMEGRALQPAEKTSEHEADRSPPPNLHPLTAELYHNTSHAFMACRQSFTPYWHHTFVPELESGNRAATYTQVSSFQSAKYNLHKSFSKIPQTKHTFLFSVYLTIHIHTRTRTRTHDMHACAHAHTQTHTNKHARTHTHTYPPTHPSYMANQSTEPCNDHNIPWIQGAGITNLNDTAISSETKESIWQIKPIVKTLSKEAIWFVMIWH